MKIALLGAIGDRVARKGQIELGGMTGNGFEKVQIPIRSAQWYAWREYRKAQRPSTRFMDNHAEGYSE